MVYNGDHDGRYGECEHEGWFDGQSQPGELRYAQEIGCENGKWVPYYKQQRRGWWAAGMALFGVNLLPSGGLASQDAQAVREEGEKGRPPAESRRASHARETGASWGACHPCSSP